MFRIASIGLLVLIPTSAIADESRLRFRLGIAPTGLIYSEEVTMDPLFQPTPPSTRLDRGWGGGGQLELAVSCHVDTWIALGGNVRVAAFPGARVESRDATIQLASLGPQVELRNGWHYARVDLGIGYLEKNRFAARGLGAGAELGVTRPLTPTIDGQLGLGASAMKGTFRETGDFNEFEYRRTAISLTLNFSFVFRR